MNGTYFYVWTQSRFFANFRFTSAEEIPSRKRRIILSSLHNGINKTLYGQVRMGEKKQDKEREKIRGKKKCTRYMTICVGGESHNLTWLHFLLFSHLTFIQSFRYEEKKPCMYNFLLMYAISPHKYLPMTKHMNALHYERKGDCEIEKEKEKSWLFEGTTNQLQKHHHHLHQSHSQSDRFVLCRKCSRKIEANQVFTQYCQAN